jgi:DNA polymerase-3 subunit beta
MKISVLQENLAKALLYINRAVSTRPNIPVLANVLIEAEKGKLKLSATNLEVGISTWIGAEVSEPGKLTVSAKLLAEFVSSLKKGKLEMLEKDQMFEVNFVDNQADFLIIPADDFPKVPEAEGQTLMEIKAVDLANAIALTSFSAGVDESRPVLTGVLMFAKNKDLTLVGVDGFRLSRKTLTLESEIKKDSFQEIVPAKSLIEIEKLIQEVADDKTIVKVYYLGAKNQLLFQIGDIEFSTRLIEGEFPPYEKIIPSESTVKFSIHREEMANMIKIVSIFARNVIGNKTRFSVTAEDKKLTLSANVVDIGKNESQAEISDLRGDDFETGFNIKFLTDMVTAIKSKEIHFESNGPTAPGVFLDPDDKDYIHIIMPMRLD